MGTVGCVSAILTAVFAFQSVIAAKADTFGARTVRYVTSSVFPLVGGALSEASRTLSSAFSLVGGVLGGVGVAVVVLSSEAQEIIRVCDRALVMYHGKVVGQVCGEEMNEHEIMRLATGG